MPLGAERGLCVSDGAGNDETELTGEQYRLTERCRGL